MASSITISFKVVVGTGKAEIVTLDKMGEQNDRHDSENN